MILEGYGLSETSPVASFNHPQRERKVGSIGTPIAGVEFRLIDDDGKDVAPGETGEIAIRGHNVMKGYWHKPDKTASAFVDGWFKTGDVARVDEDGYFYIVDRKKDLITRGGFNVYPREVEEVLSQHPAVLEAAVIGLRHEALGEEVGAAIALREGHSATPEELQASSRSASPPTTTPAESGWSTACPKARPERSCAASSQPPRKRGPSDPDRPDH